MWLKPALDHLLYTHLFIGLCAGALCWGMFTLLGGAEHQLAFCIFAVSGTIWVYNLHRTVGLNISKRKNWPERFRIFYRLRYINIFLSLATMILALYVFFQYLLAEWWILIPPIAVSLLYVFPLSTKRLIRSIPYLKIFLISFTWAWITVVIPAWMCGLSFESSLLWLLFAERFFFIMAIDIPFDIRDYEQDAHQSVDTLVHHLGVRASKRLSYLLLFACVFLALLSFAQFWMVFLYPVSHFIIYLISFLLIWNVHEERSDLYYTFGLDGTMLMMGLLELGVVAWIS